MKKDNYTHHNNSDDQLPEKVSCNPSFSATLPKAVVFQSNKIVLDNLDNSFGQDKQTDLKNDHSKNDCEMFTKPCLKMGPGQLTSSWYVEYRFRNPNTNELKRFKVTDGFGECKTIEEKKAHGVMLCLRYETMLASGWSPFEQKTFKTVVNHLQYKKRKSNVHLNCEYWFTQYFESRKEVLRDKTFSTYLTKCRHFTQWLNEKKIDHYAVSGIDNRIASSFIANQKAKKLSNTTVNSYTTTLINVWNWLISHDQRITTDNPWKKIELLPEAQKRKYPFTYEQVKMIFDYLQKTDQQMLLVCYLIFYCYIRPGREMRSIRISDIEFSQNKIWIRSESAKNKKTESVIMSTVVYEFLQSMNLGQYHTEDFLFTPNAQPGLDAVSRDYFSKRFRKVLIKLGIPAGQSIYDLKHTGNQVAHIKGMPLEQQRQQNRHHSIDQMNNYLQGMSPAGREQIDEYYS